MKNPRTGLCRVSRGQALIELALFFPLLMFMVIGATDIAGLLDDHLSIVYAARTGARVGSVMGDNQYADCAVIGAVRAALANNPNITLNQITIYDAQPDGIDPVYYNGNLNAPLEDVYPGSASCISSSPNSGTISVAPTTYNWPPNGGGSLNTPPRDVTPFTESSIGVKLDYTYTFSFTPFGGGSFVSSDYVVMPLEVIIIDNATPTPTPQ